MSFYISNAQYNEEMRRQRLEGKYLYRYLAKLTRKVDAREIVAEIELWKRAYEFGEDFHGLCRHLDVERKQDNKPIKPVKQCHSCGRVFRGHDNIKKNFRPMRRKVCLTCKPLKKDQF